ncbi:MAG: hypothetical protein U0869_02300 [Chloroflexota bacterium]
MGAPRPARAIALLAGALLFVGGGGATGQGPATVDGSAVIRAALDAFDEVGSYRYEHRALEDAGSGVEVVTTGTVVNGDPFRSIREIAVGGETGWVQVQVGGDSWTSIYGSTFAADDPGPDPHPGPLDAWAATLSDVADAGVTFAPPARDTLDGIEVLRYAGTTAPEDPTASPDPMGDEPLAAQLELIVDAATGRLVSATVASQVVDGPPIWDPPIERARLEHIRILDVDDPAATVDAPAAVPDPTPAAAGDPALAALINDGLDRLAAASAYRVVTTTDSIGTLQGEERIVVHGPEPAAEAWIAPEGRRQVGLRVIGSEYWNTFGSSGTWRPTTPTTETCFGGPCDLAGLSDPLGPLLRPIAETFTELPAETLDGVAVRHLRSEAGSAGAGRAIPGTTDLWIDAATRLPVRVLFDGMAITRDTVIAQVGDPALVVQHP